MSFTQIEKTIAGFLVRSAKAAGKKEAKPVVRALKKSIKRKSAPPSKKGEPPRKWRRKKSLGTTIKARTNFKGAAKGKDILTPSGASFLKIKPWTAKYNFLSGSKTDHKRVRPLPFKLVEKQINKRELTKEIKQKALKQINPWLERMQKKGKLLDLSPLKKEQVIDIQF